MLEEFRRHVFVNRIGLRQFKRHRKHRQAIESHPGCAVGLLQESASWQRFRTIEHANVVESQETTREKIIAFCVLAIDPPSEVEQQLLEYAFEKRGVSLAAPPRHLIDAPCRPCV